MQMRFTGHQNMHHVTVGFGVEHGGTVVKRQVFHLFQPVVCSVVYVCSGVIKLVPQRPRNSSSHGKC